jgi:hypothetical protein
MGYKSFPAVAGVSACNKQTLRKQYAIPFYPCRRGRLQGRNRTSLRAHFDPSASSGQASSMTDPQSPATNINASIYPSLQASPSATNRRYENNMQSHFILAGADACKGEKG